MGFLAVLPLIIIVAVIVTFVAAGIGAFVSKLTSKGD